MWDGWMELEVFLMGLPLAKTGPLAASEQWDLHKSCFFVVNTLGNIPINRGGVVEKTGWCVGTW